MSAANDPPERQEAEDVNLSNETNEALANEVEMDEDEILDAEEADSFTEDQD